MSKTRSRLTALALVAGMALAGAAVPVTSAIAASDPTSGYLGPTTPASYHWTKTRLHAVAGGITFPTESTQLCGTAMYTHLRKSGQRLTQDLSVAVQEQYHFAGTGNARIDPATFTMSAHIGQAACFGVAANFFGTITY